MDNVNNAIIELTSTLIIEEDLTVSEKETYKEFHDAAQESIKQANYQKALSAIKELDNGQALLLARTILETQAINLLSALPVHGVKLVEATKLTTDVYRWLINEDEENFTGASKLMEHFVAERHFVHNDDHGASIKELQRNLRDISMYSTSSARELVFTAKPTLIESE